MYMGQRGFRGTKELRMSDRESPCRYCGMMTEMESYHINLVHSRQLKIIRDLEARLQAVREAWNWPLKGFMEEEIPTDRWGEEEHTAVEKIDLALLSKERDRGRGNGLDATP